IKPANIFLEIAECRLAIADLSEPGMGSDESSIVNRQSPTKVKILDFGLARAERDDAFLTGVNRVLGTPAYMAPEQARGEALDHRADLFSLGCVLYHTCTGRPPFAGPDAISTIAALTADTPPAPHTVNPEVPHPLSDLVMSLLAKKREDRPGSAQEV